VQRFHSTIPRRSFLSTAAGALTGALWAEESLEAAMQNVNRRSMPAELKITDLRVANLGSIALVRIDTNQGISGLGETYTASSKTYPLFLKSRLLGENPCNVDRIFRKIKQFGFHSRQASGVTSVEMALWDLAGKAWGVPVYQMLGGKFRDRIRIYADTPQARDQKVFQERLKRRLEQGITWLKMDVGIDLAQRAPGGVTHPLGSTQSYGSTFGHMGGWELTDKGIEMMAEYVARVREVAGMEIPISADHFGHIGVNSCIRLGKAFQKYNLAWLEDMVPWHYTELLKQIADAVDTPIGTGEDIYLKEPFINLCQKHAVDIIHPDLSCAGGILETKKIGDAAQECGVAMALHCGATPVGYMASVHCAAATENFLALEHHSLDSPGWEDLVEGVEKPIVNRGFVKVPDGPGLGVTLNEEAVKKSLREPGYFEPTPQWDKERSSDRLWS
jgi:L-alanine-DL-glutamate epimerase-like enolase superfamily enzyme